MDIVNIPAVLLSPRPCHMPQVSKYDLSSASKCTRATQEISHHPNARVSWRALRSALAEGFELIDEAATAVDHCAEGAAFKGFLGEVGLG